MLKNILKELFFKKFLVIFLQLTILFSSCIFIIFQKSISTHSKEKAKNVLIINSYHETLQWTSQETSGIKKTFQKSDTNVNLFIEYMDYKRFQSPSNIVSFYKYIKLKYQKLKIDLILCTDNAAVNFYLKYRNEIFPNVPMVFCGLNKFGIPSINSQRNIAGVIEKIYFQDTLNTALKINPALKKIYLVYDNTESGTSTGNSCKNDIKKLYNNLQIVSLNKKSSSSILEFVKHIDKNSIVLITTYTNDNGQGFIDFNRFCKELSENSVVPVYSAYDFSMNTGILGGTMQSGFSQGKKAGEIAIRVLSGENISNIKSSSYNTSVTMYDYKVLKRFNIPISKIPKGSKILNEPFSFIKTYKTLMLLLILIFIILLACNGLLIFHTNRMRKMRKKLEQADHNLKTQFTILEDAQEKLHFLAYHDKLTGLYNRLYMEDTIKYKFTEEKLENNGFNGIIFIDTDNFKFINDSMGHTFGDKTIIEISKRLLKFTNENSSLIRFGGDEFLFFIKDFQSIHDIKNHVKAVIDSFSEPLIIDGNSLPVSISCGISIYPEDSSNFDELLIFADMAMYKAKQGSKNSYAFFNEAIKEDIIDKVNITKYMPKAFTNGEFQLYYQPQICAHSSKIIGFEALIRWDSPHLGLVSPARFIPIAEESGFIIPLGKWILESSCTFIKTLNDAFSSKYKLSVNISVMQFLQEDFYDGLNSILERTSFPNELLELEITESIIMKSSDKIIDKINLIRNRNIKIAIDDFGTGYSSLSYLRNIPINTLKIDKVFIDDICSENSDSVIADSIIDLAHKMNLSVVAEGVETEYQFNYLRDNKCDIIQGFYYSKPIPQSEIYFFIKNKVK